MQQYTEPLMVAVPTAGSLTDALLMHAQNQPRQVMLVKRDGDSWVDFTAPEFLAEVRAVAKGLRAFGIESGQRVAIMSRTRAEWTITDYAIWFNGGVTVPIYETSSAEQIKWILSDSDAVAVFVENQAHAELVESVRSSVPGLRQSWLFDDGALAELKNIGTGIGDEQIDGIRAAVKPTDLASIIYTSGTTGQPKGCAITHANFMALARNTRQAIPEVLMDPTGTTLLFLPLAHVFGRIIQIAFVESGLKLGFSPDIKDLVRDLGSFKPTFLLAVPRVFEKIFNGAQQKAEAEGKGKIFNAAAAVAIAYSEGIATGHIPVSVRVKHALFDRLVYAKLRAAMGGQVRYAVSGGAALGTRLGHFFRGVGVTVLEGWGLTETSAACTINRPSMLKVGSVGRALPGISLAIAEDGEILVKGPNLFQGYWHNQVATDEAIDKAGWFHTGDIGTIDHEGYLSITGRKKELLVTAGGKNVAPAVLEDRLRSNWLVSQCMVVGDSKPFIGALITLDPDALPQWLARHNRAANTSIEQLSHDAEFVSEIQAAVDYANQAVSQAESIRKFVLVEGDWTESSGHLTPSLKLKRNVVTQQYHQQIEGLYQ